MCEQCEKHSAYLDAIDEGDVILRITWRKESRLDEGQFTQGVGIEVEENVVGQCPLLTQVDLLSSLGVVLQTKAAIEAAEEVGNHSLAEAIRTAANMAGVPVWNGVTSLDDILRQTVGHADEVDED